ncbi:MAG: hypothetical protein AAF907_03290, partial [Planctomycetota bacterium]
TADSSAACFAPARAGRRWGTAAAATLGLAAGLLIGGGWLPHVPPPAAAADPPVVQRRGADDGQAAKTISVRDLRTESTIGLLGKPLGTVVKVTGIAVDGDTTGWKADLGRTLLRITSVNDARLKHSVTFRYFTGNLDDGGTFDPQPGDRFTVWVHEEGGFSGVVEMPRELRGGDRFAFAHDGFYFRSELDVRLVATARRQPVPKGGR